MFKNGKKASSEYSADCDDKVATVHGNVGILAPVAQKRVGPNIVEARYFKGLQVVATSRRVVSQDGNTLVITTVSSSPEGKSHTNLVVFKRSADLAHSNRC